MQDFAWGIFLSEYKGSCIALPCVDPRFQQLLTRNALKVVEVLKKFTVLTYGKYDSMGSVY